MILPSQIPAERARLEALGRYAILDTCPERAFDEIVGLASTLCSTPIALISLVDDTRQWFKARRGLEADETSRDVSFCAHAIQARDLFVVHDARSDPRFADNPFVTGAPDIRFYAGAQLTTPDGHNIGTLCVIDREPRVLTPEQQNALRVLARQVVVHLELRRQVAERTKAERALDQFFDLSLDLVCIASFDGHFKRLNPSFEKVLGYTIDELRQHPFIELVHPCDRETTLAEIANLRRGQKTVHFENRYICKDGTSKWIAWTAAPLPEEGLIYAAGRDVTSLEVSAEELRRSEAQEVERMKQDFVSTVSHELRTPLTSIRGSLGLLAAGVMGELGAEARQMVAVAERNSVRLIALINDILDFEKLESGKMEMEMRPMPLLRMLERSIETISAHAVQEDVTFDLRCPNALVLGDETRLAQVTLNLLSNAVKYSRRGGHVSVSANVLDGAVEIRVQDRGRGIASEMQHRLFQRFQQIDSSDARTKPGTGLGLAICRAIIEQHGGSIGVESREGEGSTFWFRVRRPSATAEQTPRERQDIEVSMIQDDAEMRDVMPRPLARLREVAG